MEQVHETLRLVDDCAALSPRDANGRLGKPLAKPLSRQAQMQGREAIKILVVVENIETADKLTNALTLMGYQVAAAQDGSAALATQARFHPDVAVLDLGLPSMDGCELAIRMRRATSAQLRLVALTGFTRMMDWQQSREAGFDAYLVKPVDLVKLCDLLSKLPKNRP